MNFTKSYSFTEIIQWTLSCLLVIWSIAIANLYIGYLNHYGIQPRQSIGLLGIITHPFLHADLDINAQHLLNNSLFLSFLLPITLFIYKKNTKWVLTSIVILTGTLVWILGRPHNHIGASGLIFGLLSLLITNAIFQHNLKAILSLVILLLIYGLVIHGFLPKQISSFWQLCQKLISNIFYSILPHKEIISWESHFFGTISGIIVAYAYRQHN